MLAHEIGGRSVEKVAVFDRAHPVGHGMYNRFAGVCVCGDVAAAAPRLVGDCCDLIGRVLGVAERIRRRHHSA